MIPRRVVTNINTIGKAVLQSDGVPPWSKEMVHTPGFASSFIWATSPAPKIPTSGDDPTDTATSIVPGPGETRFLVVTFPPDSVFADPAIDFAKANQEQAEESPGLVELFEPDHPGVHTTPTIDYGIVLDGEIWLELDDGKTIHLKEHDVVVQNGTRHAWRNKGETPTTMAFVLIGAEVTKK